MSVLLKTLPPAEMNMQISSTCLPTPPMSLRMLNCRALRFEFLASEWLGSVNPQMDRCWLFVLSGFNASYCLVLPQWVLCCCLELTSSSLSSMCPYHLYTGSQGGNDDMDLPHGFCLPSVIFLIGSR